MISPGAYQSIICSTDEIKLSIDSLISELNSMKTNLSSLSINNKYYNSLYNEIINLENKINQQLKINSNMIFLLNKHVEQHYSSLENFIIENEIYHTAYTAEISEVFNFSIPEAYISENCNILSHPLSNVWNDFSYSDWNSFLYNDWDDFSYF